LNGLLSSGPPKRTPSPDGYVAFHEWAEEMMRTHRSTKCKDCGRYAVWVKKKPRKTRKVLTKKAPQTKKRSAR